MKDVVISVEGVAQIRPIYAEEASLGLDGIYRISTCCAGDVMTPTMPDQAHTVTHTSEEKVSEPMMHCVWQAIKWLVMYACLWSKRKES